MRKTDVPAWLKAWAMSRGLSLVAEHRFHPERKWRLDFAFLEPHKVAIELHGSVWVQGRHTRGGGFLKDREKMNAAQALGWKVGEFAHGQEAEAVAWLEAVII